MGEIRHHRNNPGPGVSCLEIHIPDDQFMGTGTYRTVLQPNALAGDSPIVSATLNVPVFQISVAVDPATGEIPVLLGRADGSPPISGKAFGLPENIDLSSAHVLEVVFVNWQVEHLKMNGSDLQPLCRSGTEISIAPAFGGALVPSDLLQSEASLGFWIPWPAKGILFRVTHGDYFTELSVQKGCVVLCRNDYSVNVAVNDIIGEAKKLFVAVTWTPSSIGLHCGAGIGGSDNLLNQTAKTPPTIPPNSLIRLARKANILPVEEYQSEESLRQKVYAALDSVQSKIDMMANVSSFYDVTYDGKAIKSRKPKAETDIQPIIMGLLNDQMLMANIEVIPECRTGVGALDFMFIGSVKDHGICRVCAEFKNAHSKDVLHGLTVQLPQYMRNAGASYGAYCVLWYKGEWWLSPDKYDTPDEFLINLQTMSLEAYASEPLLEGVRIFVYDLSKKPPASRK
jgi:hypothetical protein